MKKAVLFMTLMICVFADAAPLKVYLFVGQSNMKGAILKMPMDRYDPEIRKWVEAPDNPVLYHYWKGNRSNATWGRLDNCSVMGLEHVAAYRLYHYWQSVDTNINVAVFTVSQGATSLNGYWTAGGRGRPHHKIPQGTGYKTLTNRLTLALSQLDSMGYTHRDIEAFFWYQGEGDISKFGGENYRLLFEDLVHGWEDRDTRDFPHEDPSLYGGSIRSLLGLSHLPTFVARINQQTKGSPSWGSRAKWGPFLASVRAALVGYTQDHPDCAWVDVDDIPLADNYHYTGENYCEIGDRFAQSCIETLYASGNPYLKILSPVAWSEYPSDAIEISCTAEARDANGDPVTGSSLSWTSSEEGAFGTGPSATLRNTSWETCVTSSGSDLEGSNTWNYTTNVKKRIKVQYTDPNGKHLVQMHWIRQRDDGESIR